MHIHLYSTIVSLIFTIHFNNTLVYLMIGDDSHIYSYSHLVVHRDRPVGMVVVPTKPRSHRTLVTSKDKTASHLRHLQMDLHNMHTVIIGS